MLEARCHVAADRYEECGEHFVSSGVLDGERGEQAAYIATNRAAWPSVPNRGILLVRIEYGKGLTRNTCGVDKLGSLSRTKNPLEMYASSSNSGYRRTDCHPNA